MHKYGTYKNYIRKYRVTFKKVVPGGRTVVLQTVYRLAVSWVYVDEWAREKAGEMGSNCWSLETL